MYKFQGFLYCIQHTAHNNIVEILFPSKYSMFILIIVERKPTKNVPNVYRCINIKKKLSQKK